MVRFSQEFSMGLWWLLNRVGFDRARADALDHAREYIAVMEYQNEHPWLDLGEQERQALRDRYKHAVAMVEMDCQHISNINKFTPDEIKTEAWFILKSQLMQKCGTTIERIKKHKARKERKELRERLKESNPVDFGEWLMMEEKE